MECRKVLFKSGGGNILFHTSSPYTLTDVTGVNEGEVTAQEIEYVTADGREYENMRYNPRTVTVTAFINANEATEYQKYRRRLMSVLNGKNKGELYYTENGVTYFSEARCFLPVWGTKQVQGKQTFTAEFELYKFYWKAENKLKRLLYEKKDMLKDTFTLPMVFTEITDSAFVYNYGDIECGYVMTVFCPYNDENEVTSFTVSNITAGTKLHFDYALSPGEKVTVKSSQTEFTVTSSKSGNIIHKLSDDSDFFTLEKGKNNIRISTDNTAVTLTAKIEFYNTYTGV